ncbi:hypothetical protein AgCh_039220 [Apium graveolens]
MNHKSRKRKILIIRRLQSENFLVALKKKGYPRPNSSNFNTLIKFVFEDEEVSFNKPIEPEVGVNSVDDDIIYVAETEDREDTDLSSPKISLELATGLNPVNEYDSASQGDQEATNAGIECFEKLELCSVSVILAMNPVDVTVVAESDDNNNIPLRELGVFEPAVMKIHAKTA